MTALETEVVVIGGGAMGSSAAWHLARRGRQVTLLERFAAGHRHGASHGASRNFNLAYAEPTHVAMLLESQFAWRELEAETSTPILDQVGLVDHGHNPGHAEVHAALAAVGIPSEFVPADEAGRRWPGIRFTTTALHLPTAGRLHADAAVRAFQAAAAAHGADVRHETPARCIHVLDDDRVQVETDGGTITARRVVVAVGGWTSKLLGAPSTCRASS